MDIFILAMFVAIGAHLLKTKYQRRRIALLGSHLGNYQIEKLMESLTEGYMRALGEADIGRREQIWSLLTTTENGTESNRVTIPPSNCGARASSATAWNWVASPTSPTPCASKFFSTRPLA